MIVFHNVQIFVTWLLITSLVGTILKKIPLRCTMGLGLAGLGLAPILPIHVARD